LCISLASGGRTEDRRRADRMPRLAAQLHAMEPDTRRELCA
jgi:hypothetical protein